MRIAQSDPQAERARKIIIDGLFTVMYGSLNAFGPCDWKRRVFLREGAYTMEKDEERIESLWLTGQVKVCNVRARFVVVDARSPFSRVEIDGGEIADLLLLVSPKTSMQTDAGVTFGNIAGPLPSSSAPFTRDQDPQLGLGRAERG